MNVLLVDENNNPVGRKEKLAAHMDGDLHRAFSVFIFNQKGDLLLQRRSNKKYHSGGVWSNTCCGHPSGLQREVDEAAVRLQAEMGFHAPLREAGSCRYRCTTPDGLIENELTSLYIGAFTGIPKPPPDEVRDWRWVSHGELLAWKAVAPATLSPWFKTYLEQCPWLWSNC